MHIRLIARREKGTTGTTRYTTNLCRSMELLGFPYSLGFSNPSPNQHKLIFRAPLFTLDANAFFSSYPLHLENNSQADIFHLTTQTLATALNFQKFSAPVVITVHDIIPWIVRKTPQYNTLRNPIDRWFYWLTLKGLKHADLIICVSEFTRQSLNKYAGLKLDKMIVIHEPIDHDLFQPKPVSREFLEEYSISSGKYILYVGSHDPRKNIPTLIRSFALLLNHRKDVQLWLVGNPHFNNDYIQLKRLVEDLRVTDYVRFFGQVSDDDLVNFYNLADVIVIPSLYEGFGLPVIEAMACKKPVIIARNGALSEVAGDAGIIIDNPLDHQLMSAKILTVLEDETIHNASCEAGYYRSFQFNHQNQANCLLKAYQSVTTQI
jgi:glycosyltransferase involved in cell wall biosynthesis